MAPSIRFDQGDTGTVNRSRSDIVLSSAVTVNAISVVGTAVFGLLEKPAGSAAALSGSGSTRSITPDVAGTYRIRIIDDNDDSEVIHTFTVRTALFQLAKPAHNERASDQANEEDTDPGTWVNESETNEGGHFKGWHPHVIELFDLLEGSVAPLLAKLVPGLGISRNATNPAYIIDIAPGACRSDDNTTTIVVSSTLSANITSSGANGLDTGSEASSTWYSVWVILNPTTETVAALLSASMTAPTLPSGYIKKRRVGIVRNDSSSNFLQFTQTIAENCVRVYRYDEVELGTLEVVASGSNTSWTAADLSAFVPPTTTIAYLGLLYYSNDAAGNADMKIRPNGSSVSEPIYRQYAGTNSYSYANASSDKEVRTDSNQVIEWRVDISSSDTWIRVMGFTDIL